MSKSDRELIRCMVRTKRELELASKNFEQASGDLIDYYAYKMKADKAKLDYLIKQIKEKDITLGIVEDLNLLVV